MTKKEKEDIYLSDGVLQARERLNLCYILTDVIHSYLVEAVPAIERVGLELKGEERHKWLEFEKYAKKLKSSAAAINCRLYGLPQIDTAVDTFDGLMELLLLIHDRTTDNPEAMQTISRYIKRKFKSILHLT